MVTGVNRGFTHKESISYTNTSMGNEYTIYGNHSYQGGTSRFTGYLQDLSPYTCSCCPD